MDTAIRFWERVDKKRGSRTLMDICESLSIPYSTIKNQRAESRYPKLREIDALADLLGTTTEYLMTGESSPYLSPTMEYIEKHEKAEWIIEKCVKNEHLLPILYAFVQCLEKEGV